MTSFITILITLAVKIRVNNIPYTVYVPVIIPLTEAGGIFRNECHLGNYIRWYFFNQVESSSILDWRR